MTPAGHRPRYVIGASEAVIEHVFSSPEHEVGGVLVGEIRQVPAETIVRAAIPALQATSERASVTFTHDAWETVHQVLERDYPGQAIVGWYHSHPGFGIFLSQHDLFIQENFFSGPGQIAHVVDPQAGTEGLFGWRDGAIAPLIERPTRRAGLGGHPRVPPPEEQPAPAADGRAAGRPSRRSLATASLPPHPASRLPPATVALDRPARRRGPRDSTLIALIALLIGLALGFGLVAAARAAPQPVAPAPVALERAGGHRS